MAATSNSGSGQKQSTSSSRFASLKVFKFAASKHSPPVPPPKENAPTNTSWVSLTSDSPTLVTPVSSDYARSQSTPPSSSVHSPALGSQDPVSASSSTSFGKGLIKFAKRSLAPKSVSRQLSEPSEDSSISLPWNFQHNLHVDEGYNGLPPTWTASLASLGYSEEEIEAINYRRTTSRAPSTVPFQHPNFPNLPSTSQLSINTTTTQNTRDRPTPSLSIRRQPSQASIQSKGTRRTRKMSTDTTRSRQSLYQSPSGNDSLGDLSYMIVDHPPPLPTNPSMRRNGHKPKKSIDTLASALTNPNEQEPSPITKSRSSHDLPPVPSRTLVQTQAQPKLSSRPSQSRTTSRDSVAQVGRTPGPTGLSSYHPPRTPPKNANQTFRVVNDDLLTQSPPPAYQLDGPSPVSVMEKPPLSSPQSQQPQQQTPQPQLRKTSVTQQRQAEDPRTSVISTSTVTQNSCPTDQSADQQDTSEVSDVDLGSGEVDEDDEEPTSLPSLELSTSSLSMSPATPAKKKKRYSLAPPRLSLGQDAFADISSWGDGLFDTLSTPPTTTDASTSSELVKKSAPVLGGAGDEKRKLETSLSAGIAGSNFTSTLLAVEERGEEKGEKKESGGPHGLTPPSGSLIFPPLTTTRSLPTQKPHQLPQLPFPQSQALAQSQLQRSPTPPPETDPVIPSPQPPTLSTPTSSSSSISMSSSNSQPKTRALPSTTTTKVTDRLTPSPTPPPARGRAGPEPPKSADSSLSKTTPTNPFSKPRPEPSRERSISGVSAAHRPLPPQKPLPTLSLMSPIPLPNPPSHVELKSKISTVIPKTTAKRDKEGEKVGKLGGLGKQQEVVEKEEKAKVEEERWPMTTAETIELMASINHDNDGLDFGGKRKDQDDSVSSDLSKETSSVSLDPRHSYDSRDSHLSVDSARFDPKRLSSTSAGSRGSTRSSSGGGLKLIIDGSDNHNDNRDSSISTSTITNATIVSGPVEVAMRVRADLVASPATPNARTELDLFDSVGLPSPAAPGAPSPVELLPAAGSRETTPKQTTSPAPDVDVVADEERSRVGFGGGRSPSPDSSTHSHSSSSATTLSSTGLSSLSSANRAAGFTRPVIKQLSGWEGEEEARKVVASSSSSPSTSPCKSTFDDESDEDGEDDDDEIEVGDEIEEAVITRISPPPGSRKGSASGLMDEVTGYRRPSLVTPPISSSSLMAHEPLSTSTSVPQVLGPVNGMPHSAGSGGSSPAQRYPSWISSVLSKVGLETFVDEKVETRDYFDELTEVAEGESGFVYQAKVLRTVPGSELTKRELQPGGVVAIKVVPILPSGSSKLEDLGREVEVMKRVFVGDRSAASSPFSSASGCPAGVANVLIMEGMYVDLQEDALWIRMELMERSLADVVALVEEGHLERIDEKVAARFASDIVQALSYLHGLGIAHRDVRSDNLLLSRDGVLKIADFSNAVTVTAESPMCTGSVGVIYWQAPEVRAGAYDPMKADIWSLGATIWEMAESTPPFHDAANASDLRDRWPPLTRAEEFSQSLHEFLTSCSNPAASRPDVNTLVQAPFVQSAARRSGIIQILKKCRTIENLLMGGRPSVDSQGTFSRR